MKIQIAPREQNNLIFYKTIRTILLIGKCAGFLPIDGLMNRSIKCLRFKWKSPYFLFIFVPSLILQTTITSFSFFDCFYAGFTIPRLPGIAFWASSFTSFFYYWKLSVNLKNTLEEIENIESTLTPQYAKKVMRRKIYLVMLFFSVFGTVDHALYLVTTYDPLKACLILRGDSGLYFKSYFILGFSFIFSYIPFNYTLGFLLQFAKLQTTICWNFSDAFFIICCIYLENKFENFNRIIFRAKKEVTIERLNWAHLQSQYTQLSKQVRIIDKHISPVICVTFLSSFLLLCQQLFYIIGYQSRPTFGRYNDCLNKYSAESYLQYITLQISTLFMSSRILLVLFLAARLHTTSKKPLEILGLIPSANYNTETLRFMDQVYHSNIALSGMGIFYFTRKTIIRVLCTLATYELVLFQMR